MSTFTPIQAVAVAAAFVALLGSTEATADEPLTGPIDRVTIVHEAVRRHPGVRAAEQRARATSLSASAAGRLPAPEAMVQVWQVPLARPYAIGDAGMVMVGVEQSFPSPGARDARERAGAQFAAVDREMATDRARLIHRDAEHAFADYVEAGARHGIHIEHRTIAERSLALARTRHAGGAAITDVTQAEVELARMDADVIGDRTRVVGARARLNALLARDAMAPLGPPVRIEPEIATWDLATSIAKAHQSRPQLRAVDAEIHARTEEARAAAREANLPSFRVAALYFAPVGTVPVNGYGANASMSLPWFWGEAGARREAAMEQVAAARTEAGAAVIPIDAEVAAADSNMRAAALRLQALRDRALPASHRSYEALWAGYEVGRTEMLALLMARRAVVDIESEIVVARASLDHALAELDASVGAEVPRRTLGPLDPAVLEEGHDHGR